MREPVTLSPLDSRSAEIIALWDGDPEFLRAAEWSVASDEARSTFWRSMTISPPEHLLRFAATTVTDVVGYLDIHGSGDRRELGFVVGPGRWGRGLGGAVARAGLEYAFDRLALQCVWAEAWATNAASIAILKGLGMRHLGRGETGSYLGESTRYEQFELNRAEWAQRQPAGAHLPRPRSGLVADHSGQGQ